MSKYSECKVLPFHKAIEKRAFDIVLSMLLLMLFGWVIFVAAVVAYFDTGMNGFFVQRRVGRYGKLFNVIKIRTMRTVSDVATTVTTANDLRITQVGRFLRKTKIDELPQLINVLVGDMSFVGPRPDVPGFADKLKGKDRIVMSIRPGITGPATLRYRDEEAMLSVVEDPERYNSEIIYPDKVRINVEYIRNYSLVNDLKYIYMTLFGFLRS